MRYITRLVKSSQRFVVTIEYDNEPDVFYVVGRCQSLSGPFNKSDNRFMSNV